MWLVAIVVIVSILALKCHEPLQKQKPLRRFGLLIPLPQGFLP